MNIPVMVFRRCLAALPLVVLLSSSASAQSSVADATSTINSLVQTTKNLNDAVRRLHSDLDRTIAMNSRNHVRGDGPPVRGADSALSGGPDVLQEAMRKLTAFRILAAKDEISQPSVLADMDRIQSLIKEVHERTENSDGVLRRLLVVSVADMDRKRDAESKDRHDRLLKARGAAEAAARRAWLELPIDLPEPDEKGGSADKAWDLLIGGFPEGSKGAESRTLDAKRRQSGEPVIPLRLPRRKRVTLVSRDSYRMALTDSGVVDTSGRHIFYEEEWVQRGIVVVRMRWRVAVDTRTGQHILLKRYPLLQFQGSLDELYSHTDRNPLWYVEPPGDVAKPGPAEIVKALADVEEARTQILAAVEMFRSRVRMSLAENDRRRSLAKETATDAGLASSTRETLFAIRAHLAGVRAVRLAENDVKQAIENSRQKVTSLASLAAWANILPDGLADPAAVEMEKLFARSDREISLVSEAAEQAITSLPPLTTQAEATFPPMQKDVIVRIRTLPAKNLRRGLVLCRQEIWHMEKPMPGLREVRRAATLIGINAATGDQVPLDGMTKYYPAQGGDLLEEIFDEYAADDLLTLRE